MRYRFLSIAGRALLSLAIVGQVSACRSQSEQPLRFFYLKEASVEYKRAVETDTSISEKADYVVVADLTTPDTQARAEMLQYWQTSIDRARIEREFSHYSLWFLRESRKTPRSYVPSEAGYTEYNRIGDHVDDLVATIEWKRCIPQSNIGAWEMRFVSEQPASLLDSTLRNDCLPADNSPMIFPPQK